MFGFGGGMNDAHVRVVRACVQGVQYGRGKAFVKSCFVFHRLVD